MLVPLMSKGLFAVLLAYAGYTGLTGLSPSQHPPPPAPSVTSSDHPMPKTIPRSEVEDRAALEVTYLEGSAFHGHVKSKAHTLAFFYAPWCGHCKRAKPEIVKTAQAFAHDPSTSIVAIDCDDKKNNFDICLEHRTVTLPMFYYYGEASEEPIKYEGGRSAADFIAFLRDPKPPPPPPAPDQPWSEVATAVDHLTGATFDDHVEKTPHTLVFFFGKSPLI